MSDERGRNEGGREAKCLVFAGGKSHVLTRNERSVLLLVDDTWPATQGSRHLLNLKSGTAGRTSAIATATNPDRLSASRNSRHSVESSPPL